MTSLSQPAAGSRRVASDFRVHGIAGPRVADASVFPRIPGYFVACAVYMIAEKAADMILADAIDQPDLRRNDLRPRLVL